MKELELSYKYVKQINPRIVMTSITPFGQTGPYKDYEGGELVNAHMGGVGYISMREGDVSKEPIKLPAHLFSFQAGLSAAVATLGALYHQSATGLGEQLDVSEQESVIQNLNSSIARYSYAKQIMSQDRCRRTRSVSYFALQRRLYLCRFCRRVRMAAFCRGDGTPRMGG